MVFIVILIFLIKNTNSNSKNSDSFKNKESSFLSGVAQFNSSFPLLKDEKYKKKNFNPKLALKFHLNIQKIIEIMTAKLILTIYTLLIGT